jgi:coproporphyrinogen III oxidase-like Fe-S oxidoreductase
MSNGSELKSKAAIALRAAGYFPLPRLWVTNEQMDLIVYMAKQNEAEVNRIRAEANAAPVEKLTREQEIERAWAMIGKARD